MYKEEVILQFDKQRTMRHTVTMLIQTPSVHTVTILAYKDAVISYGYNACKDIFYDLSYFYSLGKRRTI